MSYTSEELATELEHLRNSITKLKAKYKKDLKSYQRIVNQEQCPHDDIRYWQGNVYMAKEILEDLEEL